MTPRVDIVILNWNGWRDTLECLASVFELEYPAYRVVLCDNASSDGSMQQVRDWADDNALPWVEFDRAAAEAGVDPGSARLVLVQTGANLGFAGGNNVGLAFTRARGEADYAWLLNNDTVVDRDALAALVRRVERAGRPVQCGSQLRYYHEPDTIQALGGMRYRRWTGLARAIGLDLAASAAPPPAAVEARLDYISGASWLVPRRLLELVGPMCEDYFLYHEEIDWCERSRRDFPLCYAADSLVYHKEGRSIGSASDTRRTSLFADYYLFRSKLRFTRRFHPVALPSVWLTMLGQAANRARRGQFDKTRLILRILFGCARAPERRVAG